MRILVWRGQKSTELGSYLAAHNLSPALDLHSLSLLSFFLFSFSDHWEILLTLCPWLWSWIVTPSWFRETGSKLQAPEEMEECLFQLASQAGSTLGAPPLPSLIAQQVVFPSPLTHEERLSHEEQQETTTILRGLSWKFSQCKTDRLILQEGSWEWGKELGNTVNASFSIGMVLEKCH